MSSAIMLRPLVSPIGRRSFASKAPFVSTRRRPASAQPISWSMPEPIRLPTPPKIVPATCNSPRGRQRTPCSIAGPPASFGKTDLPKTHDLLVDMTQTIRRTFKHVARHEKGTLDPIETLKLASGSCRDLAMLMIAALRSLGIAARFVSGYLNLADDDDRVTGGNTHAWVQVYVPGPGWVDFDPSSGMVGNQNLVRVAVVREPREAIPLQGTWIGTASDHLAMKVAVKVIAAADSGARRGSSVGMGRDAGLR
jgi:hypothetical protein